MKSLRLCVRQFWVGAGIKTMLNLQSNYGNTSFLCKRLVLYLTISVSNNSNYLQLFFFVVVFFFFERENVFAKFQLVTW